MPINEFRQECRDFADHWITVQTDEFRRLGVEGDFKKPYKTMNFTAEAKIASELMKFAKSGQLYRGSKPIMWSVVERTALAEAEIEYEMYESDTVWVKFPVLKLERPGNNIMDGNPTFLKQHETIAIYGEDCLDASVVIWDNDTMDDPRQPRDLLFIKNQLWAL